MLSIPPFYNTFNEYPAISRLDPLFSNGALHGFFDESISNGTVSRGWSRSKQSRSSGKYYVEFYVGSNNNNSMSLGLVNDQVSRSTFDTLAGTISFSTTGMLSLYASDGTVRENGTTTLGTESGFATGDRIDMAVDLDNDKIWFRENGGPWSGGGDPAANTDGYAISMSGPFYVFVITGNSTGQRIRVALTDDLFEGTPPTGFGEWATDDAIATLTGTWTKPIGCRTVLVQMVGGGGSGGGGSNRVSNNVPGGGGGGGGALIEAWFNADDLPDEVYFSIGAGGAGGAGNAADEAKGTDGSAGGDTTFGSPGDAWYLVAYGGGGGSSPTGGASPVNSAGGGGGGALGAGGSTSNATGGLAGAVGGTAGGNTTATANINSVGAGGGGGGSTGGSAIGATAIGGGAGGSTGQRAINITSGGIAGSASAWAPGPSAAAANAQGANGGATTFGAGGGGGSGATTSGGVIYASGRGGFPGGAGAGGSSANGTGVYGAKGGNGAPGVLRIWTW